MTLIDPLVSRNIVRLLTLLLLLASVAISTRSFAANRALLVGVSEYTSEAIPDLRGPANDVVLMKKALARRGFQDITVLSEASEKKPVLSQIRSAFSNLAADAKKGDFVVIYLSGHGTQQPDQNQDETDGFDEVFLPSDVEAGGVEVSSSSIVNGLSDDEINKSVNAIRNKGANVWLIVDSCSSGTALRGVSPSVRARWIDPATFGFSQENSWPATSDILDIQPETEERGGVIAFYAAQPGEIAQELDFAAKVGSQDPSGWYGLMTAKLAARLFDGQSYDFDTLFLSVLYDMNGARIPGLFRKQTPLNEGTMGKAAVPGNDKAISGSLSEAYPITAGKLDAGLVHGLHSGDILALFENVGVKAEAVGHARIVSSKPLTSRIESIESSCALDKAEAECPRSRKLAQNARFARLVRPRHDFSASFSVSGPPELVELIEESAKIAGSRVRIVEHDAEITITRVKDGLSFVRGGRTDASFVWSETDLPYEERTQSIAKLLKKAARSIAVSRLGETLAGTKSRLGLRKGPVLETSVRKALFPEPSTNPTDAEYDPVAECMQLQTQLSEVQKLTDGGRLKQCDQVEIQVSNRERYAYDLNIIHIASDFSISVFYHRLEGRNALGEPSVYQRAWTACSDCPAPSSGPESLITVIAPARTGKPRLDLTPLALDDPSSRNALSGTPLATIFFEAADVTNSSRSALAPATTNKVTVLSRHWRIVPRDELPQPLK